MVDLDDLRSRIDSHNEWLLVRANGRAFPLLRNEIELTGAAERVQFGFADDCGFRAVRLNNFLPEAAEIVMQIAGPFGRDEEELRLIPRTSASELAAEVELARLKKANEIAELINARNAGTKLERVSLNVENGRLAQILFSFDNRNVAALADVTDVMTPEALIASAMLWYDNLGLRKKKPIFEIWIISEKRRIRNLRTLHALLTEKWKSIIRLFAVDRKVDPPLLKQVSKLKISQLWREKPKKLDLPADPRPSKLADGIIALAPEYIDIVFSKKGETLRFNGLPFARVRSMMGADRAWFGVGKQRQILDSVSEPKMKELIAELQLHRSHSSSNRRHDLFRTASEAWLESILRRNIKLLDANLILAPIYNQFRSSNDKIDLLALRKDGRLVIIELKTQPDRDMILQAADYWRKIELQRRKGVLAEARLFGDNEILDKPALVYLAAPALSFHYDFEFFAKAVSSEIEIWRFELHEKWRRSVKVLNRRNY